MLTDADIQKIIAVVGTKAEVQELQEGMDVLREQSQQIMQALDGIAKSIDDLRSRGN
jgi:hypothetical protein